MQNEFGTPIFIIKSRYSPLFGQDVWDELGKPVFFDKKG
jgi:hypothetical protein